MQFVDAPKHCWQLDEHCWHWLVVFLPNARVLALEPEIVIDESVAVVPREFVDEA